MPANASKGFFVHSSGTRMTELFSYKNSKMLARFVAKVRTEFTLNVTIHRFRVQ